MLRDKLADKIGEHWRDTGFKKGELYNIFITGQSNCGKDSVQNYRHYNQLTRNIVIDINLLHGMTCHYIVFIF